MGERVLIVDGDLTPRQYNEAHHPELMARLDRLMLLLGERPAEAGDDIFAALDRHDVVLRSTPVSDRQLASPLLPEDLRPKRHHPVSLRDSRRKVRRK